MIDYLQLAIDHKRVSFMWKNRKIVGYVFDYDDPDDDEIAPASLAIDDKPGGISHIGYYIKDITDLKILD